MEAKMKQFWATLVQAKTELTKLISESFIQADHQLMDECCEWDADLSDLIRRSGDYFTRHPTYEARTFLTGNVSPKKGRNKLQGKKARIEKRLIGVEHEALSVARPKPGEYPKFLREHDKLVKIGWADKSGKEYRHT